MLDSITNTTKDRMVKALESIAKDLAKLRTGKASTAMLDSIKVDYYGTEMPINQVASIAIPEARLIVIQPWDKNAIDPIIRAINSSDIDLPPQSDGNVIRLAIPALTEERRKDLVKVAAKIAEEGKISIRNIRRDAIEQIKKGQKDGDIPEDTAKRGSDKIQELTDEYSGKIDELKKKKEDEIMHI
ncbi:MAG TPA: ribosome recycling factor [candidate division Zixibacteria bacterium]|nr:ribosome recycling factor [candidate division Zixibacteria bacterium]